MTYTKLDEPLISRVHALKQAALRQDEDDGARLDRTERIKVLLQFTGDLAVVEEAGFWPDFRTARVAVGTIAAEDLERISALDSVVAIQSDRPARFTGAETPTGVPAGLGGTAASDLVHAIPPGLTGQGVVVGIVDSGIDIFHPAFRKLDGTTRITSLLDLTLRQTIEVRGAPTGGSIVLRWFVPDFAREQATSPLTFPLTASTLQAALGAFGGVAPGDIVVTGGPLPTKPLTIDFEGNFLKPGFDSARINALRLTDVTLTGGTSPKVSVIRGRLISANEINAALAAAPPPPAAPPPFVSRNPNGHGSHVAGIAAGIGLPRCCSPDRTVGLAYGADLAIVRTVPSESDILRGAAHCLEQPWLPPGTDPKPPAVVNISLFVNGTPHDGTSILEAGLDDLLVGVQRRAIVVSAGNASGLYKPGPPGSAAEESGQHASRIVPAGQSIPLKLAITPRTAQALLMDIWYAGPGQLTFALTPPPSVGGTAMIPVPPNPDPNASSVRQTLGQGKTAHVVFVTSRLSVAPSGKRLIRAQISPPPAVPPLKPQITPDVWTITLTETQGSDTRFDCWVFGSSADPFSRFVLTDQEPTRTITSPGAARLPITVGAYDPRTNLLAPYSGRGPTTDFRLKPEVCAPGIDIVSAKAGGVPPDLVTAMDGTSQAAPFVAGVIALMFEVNPDLDHPTIVGHLISTCQPPVPPVPPTQLDSGWGYGRVDAEKAILAARPAPLAEAFAAGGEPLVLPAAAYPAAHVPVAVRIRKVLDRLAESPTGRRAAELCSAQVEETRRLVNTERRVTVAWHRMHGPLLVRRLLLSDLAHDEPVPRTLGGRPVAEGLACLLDELAAAGSPALREAITVHRDFLLRLPGARLSDLDALADLDETDELDDRAELS
ncbi:S8 family serine peptidase [Streptomyces sp. NPDC051636]|uniref:S8 family serine peptidase n=1 Tax=Streptomyces sp. NPDC051636 TaxID=3365663 RepID=UPI0037B2F4FF